MAQITLCLVIGSVIGLLAALWVLFATVSLQGALAKNKLGIPQLAALLTAVPVFLGGGSWLIGPLFSAARIKESLLAYFSAATIIIFAINALPMYRLVIWCGRRIGNEAP